MFKVGQKVSFVTRGGSPEGLSGQGIISEAYPQSNRYVVKEMYVIDEGPFAGKQTVSNVCCFGQELTPIKTIELTQGQLEMLMAGLLTVRCGRQESLEYWQSIQTETPEQEQTKQEGIERVSYELGTIDELVRLLGGNE